jgi:hypothetical protein
MACCCGASHQQPCSNGHSTYPTSHSQSLPPPLLLLLLVGVAAMTVPLQRVVVGVCARSRLCALLPAAAAGPLTAWQHLPAAQKQQQQRQQWMMSWRSSGSGLLLLPLYLLLTALGECGS